MPDFVCWPSSPGGRPITWTPIQIRRGRRRVRGIGRGTLLPQDWCENRIGRRSSFGGEAAANASIDAEAGEIDRLVLLAAWTDRPPEKIKGRKLFIVARDDANDEGPRLPKIRANYEMAVGPKELVILDGSAHAQFLFATDQGERLMREILRFLSQP